MAQFIEFPLRPKSGPTNLREERMNTAEGIAERLKQSRAARGLTQEQLALKARVSARTISRLERAEIARPRRVTIERLAQALGIEPNVLTGEMPMPADIRKKSRQAEQSPYQLNVRVQPAVRTAFELVARRYRVSTTKIAQLAPLLFALVAEESLRDRRENLKKLENSLIQQGELQRKLSYLPTPFTRVDPYNVVFVEERSIERRDLFGADLVEICDYREANDNPFEVHLKAKAAIACEHELNRQLEAHARSEIAKLARRAKPDATPEQIEDAIADHLDEYIEKYGRDWCAANRERVADDLNVNTVGPTATEYRVCRSEAKRLAGADPDIVESLLNGEVPLHIMLRDRRELLKPDAIAERLEWMRKHKTAVHKTDEEVPTAHEFSESLVLHLKF